MKHKKGYKKIPLSFNRQMVRASASVTHDRNVIHSFTEIDISEPRRLIREHFMRTTEKLSFTAYIVTCLADTIKDFSGFNSFIKGNRLILLDDVTISVLVERELDGEKVPEPIGISQSQNKTLLDINKEIREAQNNQGDKLGSLSGLTWVRFIPRFLLGIFVGIANTNIALGKRYGKIAVTAVGMFSNEAVWFIPHGSATVLLTIGSISNKIIETEGKPESREHLCLTASFDHDIIDGAPASRFMGQLIETIKSGKLIHRANEKK
jgi:pyruvate/2-oxoglutarate dehydrogenase complex dihydrolipoamide acyltransferase (E2) component